MSRHRLRLLTSTTTKLWLLDAKILIITLQLSYPIFSSKRDVSKRLQLAALVITGLLLSERSESQWRRWFKVGQVPNWKATYGFFQDTSLLTPKCVVFVYIIYKWHLLIYWRQHRFLDCNFVWNFLPQVIYFRLSKQYWPLAMLLNTEQNSSYSHRAVAGQWLGCDYSFTY